MLFHDRTRVGPIDLGNEISAAEDRAVTKSKPFSRKCHVDFTMSVLVLVKALYDLRFPMPYVSFLVATGEGNRLIITDDLMPRPFLLHS